MTIVCMCVLASYGKEDGILGISLQAINSLSTEDYCLQVAGSLAQNETILFEFSLKYDDGTLSKARAECSS